MTSTGWVAVAAVAVVGRLLLPTARRRRTCTAT